MDCVPLMVYERPGVFSRVMPPDALGYRTEDDVRILGWNYNTCSFYLANNKTRTHGEITFDSHLLPPLAPVQMPPLGLYARCALLGDCRIETMGSHGIVVRSATATVAMLPSTLKPLTLHDRVCIGSVTVLVPNQHAYVFKNVESCGGAMGLVDHLLEKLRKHCSMAHTGNIDVYELNQGHVLALSQVSSGSSLMVELRGTMTFGRLTRKAPVTATTWKIARANFEAMEYLDANPWALPCTLPTVFSRLDLPVELAAVGLLREPYQCQASVITMKGNDPKLVHEPLSVPGDVLVQGYRSGRVTAHVGGVYTMPYSDGKLGQLVCPVDLRVEMNELEKVRDLCKVLGEHNVREMLPGCPLTLLMERFGSSYNIDTGIYRSSA